LESGKKGALPSLTVTTVMKQKGFGESPALTFQVRFIEEKAESFWNPASQVPKKSILKIAENKVSDRDSPIESFFEPKKSKKSGISFKYGPSWEIHEDVKTFTVATKMIKL
jgi:hypothetical protein